MAAITPVDRPVQPAERWELLTRGTLFAVLPEEEQRLLRTLHERYRLTVQEMRQLCEAARDLQMWGEPRLDEWWRNAERRMAAPAGASPVNGHQGTVPVRAQKQRLIKKLREHLGGLRGTATQYGAAPSPVPDRPALHVVSETSGDAVFGDCPVRSERTLCCNLKTIDAVKNCAFGCSYCTIQTFYGDRVAIDADLGAKLRALELEPGRFYHIGSGQSSDSLVWGNRGGVLDEMCSFAREHPDVLLEFKTKSANVTHFLDPAGAIPANVVCSWSLNTPPVIEHEEHFTAPLEQRLRAARRVADRGIKVAFHFHPMVHYAGWEHDYPELAQRILAEFAPDEVSFVSFGSVTFIKPVIREIRRRGEPTRILQTDLVKDPHGKLTYPDDLKVAMFSTMYRVLAPWRERVFMYLCMEKPAIWNRAFGWRFGSNEEFEQAFAAGTLYRKSA
ncbi:MAG: radical SAM protein [Spirochaetaceae bacterium]|nr:radical SAM protein [Spirochaetaceae bacterium]